MMSRAKIVSLAAALVGMFAVGAALAAPDRVLSVLPQQSTLEYKIVHTLHEVTATSHDLDGKALWKADGTLQVMVRAKVKSFASGDGNRDEHMMEVMEGASYPTVTFKGIGRLPAPAAYPAQIDLPISGELEMHGRKFPETMQVHLTLTSPVAWTVSSTFDVSLDKYGVERPALLLKKIDDACQLTLALTLAGAP